MPSSGKYWPKAGVSIARRNLKKAGLRELKGLPQDKALARRTEIAYRANGEGKFARQNEALNHTTAVVDLSKYFDTLFEFTQNPEESQAEAEGTDFLQIMQKRPSGYEEGKNLRTGMAGRLRNSEYKDDHAGIRRMATPLLSDVHLEAVE